MTFAARVITLDRAWMAACANRSLMRMEAHSMNGLDKSPSWTSRQGPAHPDHTPVSMWYRMYPLAEDKQYLYRWTFDKFDNGIRRSLKCFWAPDLVLL